MKIIHLWFEKRVLMYIDIIDINIKSAVQTGVLQTPGTLLIFLTHLQGCLGDHLSLVTFTYTSGFPI